MSGTLAAEAMLLQVHNHVPGMPLWLLIPVTIAFIGFTIWAVVAK